MGPDRFKRLKHLFEGASRLPKEQRSAYLDRECADDPELRAEVQRLLAHPTEAPQIDELQREVGQALNSTEVMETTTEPGRTSATDRQIGPYRLLEKIGEGGMGEVWVAEQIEPVRRRVALKVIKRGMDSDQIIARFEAERQALAMMDHPAIAKVFDAGQTPKGRPFFAMEYIEGLPITDYCDRHKLSPRERLELFARVCEGVQHAHQKAVIHRDIKPSNVLVTVRDEKAEPKIIDFGVAKATAQRLTEKTVYTELGVLIGTPEYMSPEQAEMTGQSVDTRTDVYSLGVLLYELLTGVLPFDSRELRAAGFDEIRRQIREVDPPKPSTRLGSLPGDSSAKSAVNRRSQPGTLTRLIRGDLDWITMKALEKDRTRRYGSASDLAMDLGRYLRDEPVLAGPPSGIYRAKKFVKRHKVGVGIAALLAALLVAFSAVTTVQSRRIAREAATAEQVSEFLVDLFEVSDPSEARGNTITAREILDTGAERIETELTDQPLVQARLMRVMGRVYDSLALYEQAELHLLNAIRVSEEAVGDEHPDTLRSKAMLGGIYWSQRRDREAEELQREVLEIRERTLGKQHPDTLSSYGSLALVYWITERFEEAIELHQKALDGRRARFGNDHEATLDSLNNLATVYWAQGRYEIAEPMYQECYETRRRVFGEDHPETIRVKLNVAETYEGQGRLDEAIPLAEETLEDWRRVLGDDHHYTLNTMTGLARMYRSVGRLEEAAALQAESLSGIRKLFGGNHPETIGAAQMMGRLLKDLGRYEEAATVLSEALEAWRASGGHSANKAYYLALVQLANIQRRLGNHSEAERLFVNAIESMDKMSGSEDRAVLSAKGDLAILYKDMGRYDEAERLYREGLDVKRRVLGPDSSNLYITLHNLANFYIKLERYQEAEPFMLESVEGLLRTLPLGHMHRPVILYNLASFHAVRGNREDAMTALRGAIDEGFKDAEGMADDSDLTSLHGPEFDSLVERARKAP